MTEGESGRTGRRLKLPWSQVSVLDLDVDMCSTIIDEDVHHVSVSVLRSPVESRHSCTVLDVDMCSTIIDEDVHHVRVSVLRSEDQRRLALLRRDP